MYCTEHKCSIETETGETLKKDPLWLLPLSRHTESECIHRVPAQPPDGAVAQSCSTFGRIRDHTSYFNCVNVLTVKSLFQDIQYFLEYDTC